MKNRLFGYYLHSIGIFESPNSLKCYGVQKKINAQCKAFNCFFRVEEMTIKQESNSLKNKFLSRVPFTAISEKWEYDNKYENADFIYFRKNIIDASIIRFFKKIKKHNSTCVIILEIPTFPYDKEEFKTFKDLPFKLKDRLNRKKLHKYVDLITTFTSSEKVIFKIPVLTIMNGVDYDLIPLKKKFDVKSIEIIIMSLFSHWHGFERAISGLYNYYKCGGNRMINLHFVGTGVALSGYKQLADELNLGAHISFYGQLSGKELDDVFDKCNLACDSLGLHRLGLEFSSTLKSREYCARGLPIICSSNIDFIKEDYPYFLKLQSDDEPIDYNSIVDFFDKIYDGQNPTKISLDIRERTRSLIDMKETMKPVIDYIKGEKNND